MDWRDGKLREDNASHNGDCLPQSMFPPRPFGPAGPSPAIYRSVAWLAQGTHSEGIFSQNIERFGPMILPLLGRVALWDCLFGAEAPCLLQPPPEIIRLFSPSPFSSRANEVPWLLPGIMVPQTISSNTIPAVSDPSVRPSTQELARAGSLGLAVHWLRELAAIREPWCPNFTSPLVPPLIPGAGTGDLVGGAWRIGTLPPWTSWESQRDVNQQDRAAVVTAVRPSRRPSQWSISIGACRNIRSKR
ncbi:hypothetical protein B0H65DRAFT_511137 [Neurospora tetraspora]|uniref:Uncharacterized protein n=1 Tax=Neurospora tetraspora TaxID=94610 RepID=A0AAE0J861_9PEZI|nr:hypothetical protein B0H65DRAFT_511137 [Neurospora tetraspora]